MTLVNAPEVDIVEVDRKNVWHHLTQHKLHDDSAPLIIEEANRMTLVDTNGREYLDATSGGVFFNGLPMPYVSTTHVKENVRYIDKGDFSSHLFIFKKAKFLAKSKLLVK